MTQGKSILRTPHWRNVVKPMVMARDGYLCQIKLPGEWRTRTRDGVRCAGVAQCVHHTHGIATGYDMRYLVAACRACNEKIGDPRKHNDPPAKEAEW